MDPASFNRSNHHEPFHEAKLPQGPVSDDTALWGQLRALLPSAPLRPVLHAMLEGRQESLVLREPERESAVIFHPDGIGFLCGAPSLEFVASVTDTKRVGLLIPGARRIILVPLEKRTEAALTAKGVVDLQKVERVNFTSVPLREQLASHPVASEEFQILRVQESHLAHNGDFEMLGQQVRAWGSLSGAAQEGTTYCLVRRVAPERILSACGAFAVGGGEMELSIATRTEERRGGLAAAVAVPVIQEYFARGIKTCWSCNKSNRGSMRLAEKLGFGAPVSYNVFVVG